MLLNELEAADPKLRFLSGYKMATDVFRAHADEDITLDGGVTMKGAALASAIERTLGQLPLVFVPIDIRYEGRSLGFMILVLEKKRHFFHFFPDLLVHIRGSRFGDFSAAEHAVFDKIATSLRVPMVNRQAETVTIRSGLGATGDLIPLMDKMIADFNAQIAALGS